MVKINLNEKMKRIINLAPFESKKNYDLSQVNDVSILIKTLEREDHLKQLLFSIQKYRFLGPIIIADDSKKNYKEKVLASFPNLNIDYLILPYDTGTAAGRNMMLEKVQTEFFLLCDDDFVFDSRTRVPLMKKYLKKFDLDILGGVFRQHNKKTRLGSFFLKLNIKINFLSIVFPSYQIYEYQAGFNIMENKISLYPIRYNSPVTRSDLIHNFFLARTEKVKSFGGWNPELKGGEHQNFFIRAKLANLKVGTTRKCGVIHDQWTPNSIEYQNLRNRGNEYQMIALKEFGVSKIENYKEVLGGHFGV